MEGEMVGTVQDLEVFRLAHQLVLGIYRVTRSFPREESFGMVSQLRRAAASVPANLIEGGARLHRAEYRRFVGMAKGSAAEVSYHLMLAKDLGYLPDSEYESLREGYTRAGQMLTRLAQALK
jgi:four helix bundle protein